MLNFRLISLALCLLSVAFASAYAIRERAVWAAGANYYVNPATGNDLNNGLSLSASFRTIQKAVDVAEAGDTINLAAGTYLQNVRTRRDGAAGAPITIRGPRTAVVRGTGPNRMFEINHDYITLDGFLIDGFRGGSTADRNNYSDQLIYAVGTTARNGVTNLRVINMALKNALGECVRMKYFARNNEVAYNTISNCGVEDFVISPGRAVNGEGVYIGTAPEQLNRNPTGDVDGSNNNRVHHNVFDTQGNECVDIKEGSSYNIVECNRCTGQRDPNSAGFDSRGNYNTFRNNESYGNRGSGIRFGGDTAGDGINNDAYGNNIHDNQAGGIKFQRQTQGLICGNQMNNNSGGNAVGTFRSQFRSAIIAACPSGTMASCGSPTPTPPPRP